MPLFICTLLAVLAFWALSAPVSASQIVIDSDGQFQFALQTLELGEYQRAVVEFERFIHFFPESEKVPRARYLIGAAYLKGKQYEAARKVLNELYESTDGIRRERFPSLAFTILGNKADSKLRECE